MVVREKIPHEAPVRADAGIEDLAAAFLPWVPSLLSSLLSPTNLFALFKTKKSEAPGDSPKGFGSNSQHPHGSSHLSLTSVPGDPMPSLVSVGTDIHAGKTCMHLTFYFFN